MANIYTIYADHKENITAHEFVAKMSMFLDKTCRAWKNDYLPYHKDETRI